MTARQSQIFEEYCALRENDSFERYQLDRRSWKKGVNCCIIYNRFEIAELNMQFRMFCRIWAQMGYQRLKRETELLKFFFLSRGKAIRTCQTAKNSFQKENRIVHSGLQAQQDTTVCAKEKKPTIYPKKGFAKYKLFWFARRSMINKVRVYFEESQHACENQLFCKSLQKGNNVLKETDS